MFAKRLLLAALLGAGLCSCGGEVEEPGALSDESTMVDEQDLYGSVTGCKASAASCVAELDKDGKVVGARILKGYVKWGSSCRTISTRFIFIGSTRRCASIPLCTSGSCGGL